MHKKFYLMSRPDSGRPFAKALESIGCVQTNKMHSADFLICDHEPSGQEKYDRLKRMFANKPIFIIPHTPYASYFIWDGLFEPWNVQCNFVVAEGARTALHRIGYPNRVEAVGFYSCDVKPFRPTKGTYLLFAPAHPLRVNGKYPRRGDLELHKAAMRWIVEHKDCFEKIVVRYGYNFSDNGLDEFIDNDIEFVQAGELNAASAIRAMQAFDLIISCGTFGYLSHAQGKPTVLYGYKSGPNSVPHNARGYAKSYHLYQELFEYPRSLETLSAQEVLDTRLGPYSEVEQWKQNNIGESFNPDKFISIVKEYI